MDTSHKLHTWIIVLLLWNAILLILLLGLLYFRPAANPSPSTVAADCQAATLQALQDTCSKL